MFSIRQIEDLVATIDAQELNIEIWVPEPVLWEWAEHAYDMAARAQADYLPRRKRMLEAGFDGFEAEPDFDLTIDEVVESIEESLVDVENESGDEAVRILQLHQAPEVAVSAIRDQVLRQGAGRTKTQSGNPIKTGASDSASFRLIEREGEGFIEQVVLVSGDGDAFEHFAGKPSPVIISDLWRVRTELIKLRKGSDLAAESLQRTILETLRHSDNDYALLKGADLSGETMLFNPRRDLTYIPEASVIRISEVRNVDEVEISLREKTATAIADVTLDMSIEYVRWDYLTESIDSDVDEEYDVDAYVYISADAENLDEWDFSVDRVEIVDERYRR